MATWTIDRRGFEVYVREDGLSQVPTVQHQLGDSHGKMSHADFLQFREAGRGFDDLFVDMLNWNFWVVEVPRKYAKDGHPGRYLVKTLKTASLSESISEFLACSDPPSYPNA